MYLACCKGEWKTIVHQGKKWYIFWVYHIEINCERSRNVTTFKVTWSVNIMWSNELYYRDSTIPNKTTPSDFYIITIKLISIAALVLRLIVTRASNEGLLLMLGNIMNVLFLYEKRKQMTFPFSISKQCRHSYSIRGHGNIILLKKSWERSWYVAALQHRR